ncbi:MAG: hypothetical protein VBE63_21755 [Lamprobacter sp.]|uniref:hypothetical protein n=1 Tax=Lamprobacter sp. TaxID=3100796 RepID=UPI002B25C7F8|nr:hypothetical protein [Lamprobacter sp.]MEA3642543.1 hypothetical protein [Lamprobacter sp.]
MTDQTMTQEQVQARIADWLERVHDLYATIKDWVQPIEGFRVVEHQDATMYEELMHRFGISPQAMPTLDFYDDNDLIARVKPIGLWIIGANGRVDLMSRNGGAQIIDESEPFQGSKWIAHDREDFLEGQLLTKDYLLRKLGIPKHECV